MYDERMFELLKGSTILDEEVFKRKNKFFYDTAYDILIKGDLGNSLKYLEIFQECEKKARINPMKEYSSFISNDIDDDNLRNCRRTSNQNVSMRKRLSNDKIKLVKSNKSRSANILNNVSNNQRYDDSLSKSQSSSFMGNSVDSKKKNLIKVIESKPNLNAFNSKRYLKKEKSFILPNQQSDSHKRNKLSSMISLINSSKRMMKSIDAKQDLSNDKSKREEGKNYQNLELSERSRTLFVLKDYLEAKRYEQIKSRYYKLFGRETFAQKIKKTNIKLSKSSDMPLINDDSKEQANDYIRVLNNIAHQYNQKLAKNKYETIGKVKVLNIPKDFYNSHDLFFCKNDLHFEQNAKELYCVDNKSAKNQQYVEHLSRSKGMKMKNNSVLLNIIKEFTKVEVKGNQIKSKILNLRRYLCEKSPIIDQKIFAFIDNDLKNKQKTKR